jgi:peroxiredoxin
VGGIVLKTIKTGLWGLLMALSTVAVSQDDGLAIFSDFDGKPQQLEDHIGGGKWLVVMIWASDCQICNAEAATYARFHESQREKGVGVLGVSMDGQDNKAAALAFIERHDLPFPNLIGEPGMVSLYYAALTRESLRGTPTFLIFDPDGELAAAQAGAVSPDAINRFIAKKNATRPAGPKATQS